MSNILAIDTSNAYCSVALNCSGQLTAKLIDIRLFSPGNSLLVAIENRLQLSIELMGVSRLPFGVIF